MNRAQLKKAIRKILGEMDTERMRAVYALLLGMSGKSE